MPTEDHSVHSHGSEPDRPGARDHSHEHEHDREHDHHDHDHGHAHGHVHGVAAERINLRMGFAVALNLIFVLIEGGFGFASNSVALIADAGDNLSDVLG